MDSIYNKIATDVAMMKFKHVKITRNTDAPDKMQWLEFSDLSQCLTISPNEYETPIVFWSNVVRKMLEESVAVVFPNYSNGILKSLHLAKCVIDYADDVLIVQIGNSTKKVNISSVWIFENPKKNLSAQLGQITRLIDENLRSLSAKLAEENSNIRGLLKIPTIIKDGSAEKYAEERVNNIVETAKIANVGYLQKDEAFQELSNTYSTASESEMEFLLLQLYQAFGLNKDLFTCNYTEGQFRAYYSSVLKVFLRVISEEINRKFFSKTARTQGQKLLTYFDMTDLTSMKDLSEFVFKSRYTGIMNANEIREMFFGLPAFEGGEIFESNKNAVPLGNTEEY